MKSSSSILILGAGNSQVPMILAARRMGLRVVAADRNPEAPGLRWANVKAVVDIKDRKGIVSPAKAYGTEATIRMPINHEAGTLLATGATLWTHSTRQVEAL